MDDITWPPRKRPSLKIVPGPRSQQEPMESLEPDSVSDELPEPRDTPADSETPKPETGSSSKPPKKRKSLYLSRIHLSKKQWALVGLVLLALLAGGFLGARALYRHFRHVPPPAPAAQVAKTEAPKPTTEPSRLTGVEVAPELNLRPVTGIMVENSPDARPQAGLNDAGVVFEAVAEGGITRFLALYQEARPASVGPVRSVRPYYLDFLLPFDAAIAHVGGSPQALAEIKSLGVKDLDQFANSGSYMRVNNRFAPHNVYTDFDKMDALNTKKGFTSSNFSGFPRKAEAPSKTPDAKLINLAISGPLYNVRYDYNPAGNNYLRIEGGAIHKDERSGAQLAPKVVVAVVMSRGIASDGQHTQYGTTGSGQILVFQDGVGALGTWQKTGPGVQFAFLDSAGQPLKFNPGQTWITLVDGADKVTYAP